MTRHRVALTGIGVVTPLGNSVQLLWSNLCAGISGTRRVTGFDASEFPSQVAAEVLDFDPRIWMSAKVMRRTGRATQFALAAASMALDDAGWMGAEGTSEAAVIVGGGYGSMSAVEEAYRNYFTRGWQKNSFLAVPMCMPNAPGSQIAIEMKLRGPSFTVAAACASGAMAIGTAVHLLRAGVVRRVVSGGVDAAVLPGVHSIWCRIGVLSQRNDDPAGACAPFSGDRDGLVLGEGACIVTLERLEDAERRGAHVYAEIVGVGATCDAENITAPSREGEVEAMRTALADAGLRPEDIDYINAHGTATRVNDAVETSAIREVFGGRADHLPTTSSKSMLGHTMGASSAIECALTALTLEHQVISPTINLRVPDPQCDLDYVPDTARKATVRAAISNSFAFGGSNVILALSRYRA